MLYKNALQVMHLVSQHSKAGATNPTFQGNRVSNSSAEKRVLPGQDPPPSSQCPGQWFQPPPLQAPFMITTTLLLHAAGTGFPAGKGYFTSAINQLEDH